MRKKGNQIKAFTIIELLTVMSIIIILLGLLVPATNAIRRFANELEQRKQIAAIGDALELFRIENGDYPDSDEDDEVPLPYCGAMKLAEAMVGQDLLGFHPDSKFRQDGEDGFNNDLYPDAADITTANIKMRRNPYINPDTVDILPIESLWSNTSPFNDPCSIIICDTYTKVQNRGTRGPSRIGMPLLYYRADIAKGEHTSSGASAEDSNNIYDYKDNDDLVQLDAPWDSSLQHSIAGDVTDGPDKFYDMTQNKQVVAVERPYNPDTYILISAGYDGIYGTRDDICNFRQK